VTELYSAPTHPANNIACRVGPRHCMTLSSLHWRLTP